MQYLQPQILPLAVFFLNQTFMNYELKLKTLEMMKKHQDFQIMTLDLHELLIRNFIH
jgi:hypothetical protein